ncbi:MAG: sensor histidine kinase [Xanthomonadaceae bacterium]|nr:sensor histidine kinase [Xanthomonadaceae bacterium]MDE2244612.1 sensor histidine kinase [Xanthomonadaceae bacterium]
MRFDIAPDSILGYTRGTQPSHKAWRFALANLVWGVWIVAVPVLNSMPWRAWMPATLLSYALFIWLYLRAYAVPVRQIKGYVAAIAALGFVLSPVNPGALTYVIYACVFSGFAFRGVRISLLAMLGLLAAYTVEARALGWSWPTILSVTLWALVIGGMNMMYRSKGQADAQLRLSHEEIRRLAATAERERIGRDLHDLLGHTLSLVALKSELAARLVERDAAAAGREMREVERVAREALTQVRAAVSGLHAPQLLAEMASARLLLETAGILVDSRTDTADLPPALDAALAMVLREAATNIQRHASAHRVGVVLTRTSERVRLCIEDDGCGGVVREGNGLIGMRERLAALGGTLQIDSEPGHGTRLCADLGCPRTGAGLAEGALAPGRLCAAAAMPVQRAIVTQAADSAAAGSTRRGAGP